MTRSINIIQQPDCYRTYNKKTHIERAGRDWFLLAGVEFPVTSNQGFRERFTVVLVKGF